MSEVVYTRKGRETVRTGWILKYADESWLEAVDSYAAYPSKTRPDPEVSLCGTKGYGVVARVTVTSNDEGDVLEIVLHEMHDFEGKGKTK